MAIRTQSETTSSGGSATRGTCRNHTFHQPTYTASGQLYHSEKHQNRHTIQLAGPTTISVPDGSMETYNQTHGQRPCRERRR